MISWVSTLLFENFRVFWAGGFLKIFLKKMPVGKLYPKGLLGLTLGNPAVMANRFYAIGIASPLFNGFALFFSQSALLLNR